MANKHIQVAHHSYTINYEIINQNLENCMLILHGWGANKEIMKKAFASHLSKFKQIYVDLPGFGSSPLDHPLDTKDYAAITKEFLQAINQNPDFIMGHSFGGKVATLLEPKNLILLSTAGIVTQKPFLVRLKIAIFKMLKKLGFGKFYSLFATKDVAGMSKIMYETLKNVVDEDFRDIFANTSSKTLIFWGEGDRATSLRSGETISRLIKGSQFFPLSGDHFFFLLHAKFISGVIGSEVGETC
ncbi:alpha/beta hydrolase family protein [Campylobacter iguaniorum]|uniref:Alpha/beta hydrolase family protein n=1 Tax=Campylobacter iguaniorum TaxID=1244531 RepID=A0A076FAB8_9BACT|nr:alpha/beta hydrolase [Campylobacter iguaniorum]AII14901.1 alpha/beta hydrolase family protein [Campylobacter iguaniorum]